MVIAVKNLLSRFDFDVGQVFETESHFTKLFQWHLTYPCGAQAQQNLSVSFQNTVDVLKGLIFFLIATVVKCAAALIGAEPFVRPPLERQMTFQTFSFPHT